MANNHEVNCMCTACSPSQAGYSVGKWSDDDDWHPIIPFRGKIR
jgi:hypothetical protein